MGLTLTLVINWRDICGQLAEAQGTPDDATAGWIMVLLSGAVIPLVAVVDLPQLFWSAWAMFIASEIVESSHPC